MKSMTKVVLLVLIGLLMYTLTTTVLPPMEVVTTTVSPPMEVEGKTNIRTVVNELQAANSATGVLFSGKTYRSYTGRRYFMAGWELEQNENHVAVDQSEHCDQWAVVTTISGPTEAIRVVAELPGWCTVVVADTKTPVDFVQQANLSSGAKMYFLSVEGQEAWAKQSGGAIADFIRSLPYKHFARKNIGYLYAIYH